MENGKKRTIDKFSFLPVRLSNGDISWLKYYWVEQIYHIEYDIVKTNNKNCVGLPVIKSKGWHTIRKYFL